MIAANPTQAGIERDAQELAGRLSPESSIHCNEPLARRTTLRVGGPADLYVEPASEADLQRILQFCGERSLRFFVLGRGSNLLVRDAGFRGVVISLAKEGFGRIEISGSRLSCGAGAKLKIVAVEARRNGIAGLEFLEGIPGSVGGALRMNAGAMNSVTFDVVEAVRVMNPLGEILRMIPAQMSFAYRCCGALKSNIALGAVLRGRAESPEVIGQRMIEFSRRRWSSQPASPSAGCMFKNPPEMPAGKLIDELGLKGTRIGGAVVSREHGNFLVTDGQATARDVLRLIDAIRERVNAAWGIELQTEVEVIGDE